MDVGNTAGGGLGAAPKRAIPRQEAGNSFQFLEGVRVLDLTTSVAGPVATMALADMGADVIKVERPGGGDDTRAWGPPFLDGESLWFTSVNRNKRSITLDYAGDAGRAVLGDLLKHCDVLVVNQPPRVAAKLGIDPETLTGLKPDLIYVSITGFGLTGPRADWACYDLIAEGYSGIMDLTGEIETPPQKVGTPAADMLAGQDAAFAAVSALVGRARTGKGCVVDVALVDSMIRFLACRIVPYIGSGEVPRRSGGRDSVIAIYQAFHTADDPITLGLGNDNIWQRFWETVGQPEIARDPRYCTNADRRRHRAEIVDSIQAILLAGTRDHWLRLFTGARVPAGPINRVDEVAQDQTLIDRGLFYKVAREDGSLAPQVGTGFLVNGRPNLPRSAPPRLGEHRTDVLSGLLGYDEEAIGRLERAGAI